MNKNIEQMAVNAVHQALEKCSHLAPVIKTQDREILTDGYIDVYNPSAPTRSTKSFKGRVDVQIKGQTVKKFSDTHSFPVQTDALSGYLRQQGVLYFVVAIKAESAEKRVYYNLLSTGRLNECLKELKPNQKQKSLHFTPLPDGPAEIADIVEMALKQQTIPVVQDLSDLNMANVKKFNLSYIHHGTNDWPRSPLSLNQHSDDFAFTVETKRGIYLLENINKIVTEHDPAVPTIDKVSTGRFEANNCILSPIEPQINEIRVTKGISLLLREDATTEVTFTYSPQGNLKERYFDLNFMISIAETGVLSIGDSPIRLAGIKSDAKNEAIRDLLQHREALTPLVELCDALEIDSSLIDPDEITDEETVQLHAIHDAICRGNELLDLASTPTLFFQSIGSWFIRLIAFPTDNPRMSTLAGFTDTPHFWALDYSQPAPTQLVTPYELITPEQLPRLLNLRPSRIHQHYQKLPELRYAKRLASQMVWEFLDAADANPKRSEEFLLLAENLNNWNLSQNTDDVELKINSWQIAARKGALHNETEREIRKTRLTLGKSPAERLAYIACTILLGDHKELELLPELASVEALQLLRSSPIWSLHEARTSNQP